VSPEQIIQELSNPARRIPEVALREAFAQQVVLKEPLLYALRDFVARTRDPAAVDDRQDMLADMAMYLLAQFREPRAFPLYEALCRLPEESSDYWLGDMLLQDFPSFLASTCEGNPAPLQRLAEEQSLPLHARWAVLDGLLTLVAQGVWSRRDMIAWLLELWPCWQAPDATPDLTALASMACDLAAAELLPLTRAAYAAGHIDWRDVDMIELEQRCELGEPASVDATDLRRHYVEDSARQMSWQARYASEPSFRSEEDFDDYEISEPYVRATSKIGRNDPCFCGSGKKYKKCCLHDDGRPITDLAVLR